MVLGIQPESLFLEPSWLYALLALIPLIIIYLIKPKPKEKTIPSLMFFLKNMGNADKRSFFKRFSKDWLFLLQLLVLMILALSIAKPFTMVSEKSLAEHSVIIIDASASMQASMDGTTRFDEAKKIALDNLGSTNTIIVAKNIPVVAKEDAGKDEAKEFIRTLETTATSTAIYDAVRTAIDYSGEGSRVIVVSDFIETEVDSDVNTVKKALLAKGAIVEYISLAGESSNIGIVDVVVKEDTTSVQVRNFNSQSEQVRITVGNIEEVLTIPAESAEVFTFTTPTGVSTIEIHVDDDLPLDDKAYISTPKSTTLRVLFITNENIENTNLWIAMNAISDNTNYNLEIDTVIPPKTVNVDHDIIIMKDFDQSKALPGTFRDAQKRVVENGASAIITAQQGLFQFSPMNSLLPVNHEGENAQGSDIEIAKPEIASLTEDINFGHADYYFKTSTSRNARTIASAKTDNSTLIAYEKRGAGSILYYGLFDSDLSIGGDTKTSTFKNDLFYPIFWKRTIDLLTETPSVDTLNRRTGRVINLAEGEDVRTPDGNKIEGVFLMDRQGLYTYKNQDIAVNLLNAKESDIAGKFTEKDETAQTEETEREVTFSLVKYFIIAGLILLFLELLYTKFRGDM